MTAVSFWIYTIVMVFLWGFFLIAKIHFFKFKEYSSYVFPITKIVMLLLVFFTILWYYLIYNYSSWVKTTQTIEESVSNENY